MRLSILALAVCSAAGAQTLAEQYKATADRLIDAALADTEGYRRLTYLCDRIGHRLAGSAGLEKAIAWSAEQMKAAGLSNGRNLTQTEFAKVVRSSQSRVAKMETGDPTVSLDLLIRSLFALGASRKDLAKLISDSRALP